MALHTAQLELLARLQEPKGSAVLLAAAPAMLTCVEAGALVEAQALLALEKQVRNGWVLKHCRRCHDGSLVLQLHGRAAGAHQRLVSLDRLPARA